MTLVPLGLGWSDVIGWVVSAVLGFAGGALSGDIVAKRAFRREQQAQAAARTADWSLTPTGTAMAQLRNIGDDTGLNVRLSWAGGADGRLRTDPIDRIDPGDLRALEVAPLTPARQIDIAWERPDGQTRTVRRELPRHGR